MHFLKRITVAFFALACLLSAQATAEGVYHGSYPAEDVYITQSRMHTCTLVAATMMLRNYSCQNGHPYIQVTSSGVEHYAWTKEYGLSQNFTIGQVSVTCSAEIHEVKDKKAYLINALNEHPEGVVIYDTGAPHAIWLFGYNEDCDTFYCADTIGRNGGRSIVLEDSIIRGATQDDKVNTIDKIWYIVKQG